MSRLLNDVRVSHYATGTQANISVIAAIAIVPILSIAGIAIDVQMTITQKAKVQAVIDSAVIAGSKAMQAGKTQQEISTLVTNYVDSLIDVQDSGLSCADPELAFEDGTQFQQPSRQSEEFRKGRL